MRRIAIFQEDLSMGGIQKSLVNLVKNLDYSAVQVDLYLSKRTEFWSTEFPEELNIKYLDPIPFAYSFMPFDMAKRLARIDFGDCGTYDLAIDFNSYQFSCALGAIMVPAQKRVMWVHNDVEIKLGQEWKYRVLWHFFKGKFKYFDEFVCVSGALEEPFKKMSGIGDKKISVIQNYIDVQEIRDKMREEPEGLIIDESCVNFVALGRLCHQKGFDITLDMFKKVCAERDDIRLYIIGDGEERQALEKQAEDSGIGDKVFFLGGRSNPFSCMSRMDAFISTSRYEGQGMNIAEAMVIGLPVYCAKRLERYMSGFEGYEDGELIRAIAAAGKGEKRPADLSEYNKRIIDSVTALAGE